MGAEDPTGIREQQVAVRGLELARGSFARASAWSSSASVRLLRPTANAPDADTTWGCLSRHGRSTLGPRDQQQCLQCVVRPTRILGLRPQRWREVALVGPRFEGACELLQPP